jgi:hypothetical protein
LTASVLYVNHYPLTFLKGDEMTTITRTDGTTVTIKALTSDTEYYAAVDILKNWATQSCRTAASPITEPQLTTRRFGRPKGSKNKK